MEEDKKKLSEADRIKLNELSPEANKRHKLFLKQLDKAIDLFLETIPTKSEVEESYRQLRGTNYIANRISMIEYILHAYEWEKVQSEDDIPKMSISGYIIEKVFRELMGVTDEFLLTEPYYAKLIKILDKMFRRRAKEQNN